MEKSAIAENMEKSAIAENIPELLDLKIPMLSA
jgi:acetyl-CoA carboxylase alpha subunit